MAKTHKPHVVQTEKIDTSSMTKKELAKYLPDADGTVEDEHEKAT